jgi:hypothetical protein
MIKEKLAAVVVAGVLFGAGIANAAGGAFPGNADEGSTILPPLSTYADRHVVTPGAAVSAFPGNANEGSNILPPLSTRADQYRGAIIEAMMAHMYGNPAFPKAVD